MFFDKSIGENIGKSVSKKLSDKYSQNFFDYAKQSATDALKITSEGVIQKTAERAGDLIDNEIAGMLVSSYNDKIIILKL